MQTKQSKSEIKQKLRELDAQRREYEVLLKQAEEEEFNGAVGKFLTRFNIHSVEDLNRITGIIEGVESIASRSFQKKREIPCRQEGSAAHQVPPIQIVEKSQSKTQDSVPEAGKEERLGLDQEDPFALKDLSSPPEPVASNSTTSFNIDPTSAQSVTNAFGQNDFTTNDDSAEEEGNMDDPFGLDKIDFGDIMTEAVEEQEQTEKRTEDGTQKEDMDSFDGLDDLFPEYVEKELDPDGTVADSEPEDDIFEKNPINTDNFDEDFWKNLESDLLSEEESSTINVADVIAVTEADEHLAKAKKRPVIVAAEKALVEAIAAAVDEGWVKKEEVLYRFFESSTENSVYANESKKFEQIIDKLNSKWEGVNPGNASRMKLEEFLNFPFNVRIKAVGLTLNDLRLSM